MNKIEFYAMNNPVRAFLQDVVEAKTLRKYSTLPDNKVILEIGCGNGTGTKLIKKYFNPREIHAIDLDQRMIDIAIRKNRSRDVHFKIGDASKLTYADNTFDGVVDFGIIHHIPNWKDCVRELLRVLKPGGQLIMEDLSIETFENTFGQILKNLLVHPYKEMYRRAEFLGFLETSGFKVKYTETYSPFGFRYFIVIAEK